MTFKEYTITRKVRTITFACLFPDLDIPTPFYVLNYHKTKYKLIKC